VRLPLPLIGSCLSVAACFSPTYPPEGSACSSACPGDLRCVDGRCVRDGQGPIDASIDASATCPSGYVLNASTGSSYRVVGTPTDMASATADCASDSARAYLAIADSLTENTVLDALAVSDTWLGITDFAMEGIWGTVIGTIQTYFRWASGQPDGGTAESCAFLADGAWQDASCAISKPYICECR